jgi:hypothetical protein
MLDADLPTANRAFQIGAFFAVPAKLPTSGFELAGRIARSIGLYIAGEQIQQTRVVARLGGVRGCQRKSGNAVSEGTTCHFPAKTRS